MKQRKSKDKGTLIRNLAEFLDWRGCGSDPYQWARAFYKYTDCGPWVNFLELESPAQDIVHPATTAIVRCVRGKAKLMNQSEVDPKLVQLLSLDEQGLSRKERSWDHYCKLVHDYLADEAKQARTGRTLELVKQTATELHLQAPERTEHVEARYRRVYYEDLARERGEYITVPCSCTLEACGHHPDDPLDETYSNCEPDPECELCHGRGTLQHWKGTGEPVATLDPDKCCGIEFGSIVEGSDAYSGPFTHLFPFWSSEWEHDEEHMEEETSFYWKRDNARWYRVRIDDRDWVVADVWGDIEWEGEPPPEPIKSLAEQTIENDWQSIPTEPSMWAPTRESYKDWQALPLGDTGAEILSFECDDVF